MWPFVEHTCAQRASVNRPRGAIITTIVTCTRDWYRQMLIENVIPAIKEKWPDQNRNILIQQDGASAHITAGDFEFRRHAQQGVWNI